jgi:hypothetical protein
MRKLITCFLISIFFLGFSLLAGAKATDEVIVVDRATGSSISGAQIITIPAVSNLGPETDYDVSEWGYTDSSGRYTIRSGGDLWLFWGKQGYLAGTGLIANLRRDYSPPYRLSLHQLSHITPTPAMLAGGTTSVTFKAMAYESGSAYSAGRSLGAVSGADVFVQISWLGGEYDGINVIGGAPIGSSISPRFGEEPGGIYGFRGTTASDGTVSFDVPINAILGYVAFKNGYKGFAKPLYLYGTIPTEPIILPLRTLPSRITPKMRPTRIKRFLPSPRIPIR